MAETRTLLAELPDPNKLVAFDRDRRVMVTMVENAEKATRPRRTCSWVGHEVAPPDGLEPPIGGRGPCWPGG